MFQADPKKPIGGNIMAHASTTRYMYYKPPLPGMTIKYEKLNTVESTVKATTLQPNNGDARSGFGSNNSAVVKHLKERHTCNARILDLANKFRSKENWIA